MTCCAVCDEVLYNVVKCSPTNAIGTIRTSCTRGHPICDDCYKQMDKNWIDALWQPEVRKRNKYCQCDGCNLQINLPPMLQEVERNFERHERYEAALKASCQNQVQCPICFEEKRCCSLTCGHPICQECDVKRLQLAESKRTCPTCRAPCPGPAKMRY